MSRRSAGLDRRLLIRQPNQLCQQPCNGLEIEHRLSILILKPSCDLCVVIFVTNRANCFQTQIVVALYNYIRSAAHTVCIRLVCEFRQCKNVWCYFYPEIAALFFGVKGTDGRDCWLLFRINERSTSSSKNIASHRRSHVSDHSQFEQVLPSYEHSDNRFYYREFSEN